MRVSSVLRLAFALTTVAVAAACSTTVSGNGREHTPAARASSTHGFPSQPASSSGASSSSAPPTTPATTPAPPRRPTRAQLDARLAALTPGQRHLLVAIPGGFEAISYDQSGHIGFWRNSGAAWLQVGASTYPYSSAIGAPADAAATGALLRDMQHATFIVTGVFTTTAAATRLPIPPAPAAGERSRPNRTATSARPASRSAPTDRAVVRLRVRRRAAADQGLPAEPAHLRLRHQPRAQALEVERHRLLPRLTGPPVVAARQAGSKPSTSTTAPCR